MQLRPIERGPLLLRLPEVGPLKPRPTEVGQLHGQGGKAPPPIAPPPRYVSCPQVRLHGQGGKDLHRAETAIIKKTLSPQWDTRS